MPGDTLAEVAPQVVVELIGGQGTINVNSWSPDSTKFGYVTFEAVPPQTSTGQVLRGWFPDRTPSFDSRRGRADR